jgi:type IV secretion system protein VirD4
VLKRPTTTIKWGIALSIPLGLASFLPVASWVYAELCDYKFMVVVWLSGLQHGLQPDNLLLAGLAGGASAIGIPAFVAFALLPPKPLHGSARLARPGEIAKAKLYKAGAHSILLGRHRGKLLAFNGDLHPFLAAATGTGKGVGFVVPNLLHWQGSAIVLDIKGENYNLTSGYRGRLLGQRVFRFDPLEEHGRTHGFNVLDYVRDGDLRVTDVQTVAAILVPNESNDPYWDNVARDLLIGLTLLVLEAGPAMGWPVTIGQVHRLLRSEEESGEYLQALLEELGGKGIEISSLCKRYVLSFCNEPEKPRGSIKSALATKLTLWANPLIDRATSHSDFDLRRFRREPQSLYIAIAPDDLQRLAPLVRLLIEFFLSSNTKAGETPADDPGLSVPVLMLLDEFLSLGRVDKLVHALSYVRGWGIRIATVIQSEAQLQAVYGRELAEAFIDNHRARVYYRPPVHRRDLAEAISKIVGQKTVNQTSFSYGDGRRSKQVSKTGQSILDADEIANLNDDETIVLVEGVRPLVGQKLRYYRDKTFKRRQLQALPLPAPLNIELQDAPRVTIRREDDAGESANNTIEPANSPEQANPDRYTSAGEVSTAIDEIPVPRGQPSPEELEQMAEALAEITYYADPEALAAFAEAA